MARLLKQPVPTHEKRVRCADFAKAIAKAEERAARLTAMPSTRGPLVRGGSLAKPHPVRARRLGFQRSTTVTSPSPSRSPLVRTTSVAPLSTKEPPPPAR